MIKIFRPEHNNSYYSLLWVQPTDRDKCTNFNFGSMRSGWSELNFAFYRESMPEGKEPDIAILVPGLAFRKDLESLLFPVSNPNIELLPITVDGTDWMLVNCLNSINQYDEKQSIFYRDNSGTIFMVQRLIVNDIPIDTDELFTIDGSNRSTVFVSESFVNRVKHLRLKGLNFKHIGEARYKGYAR